jgi:hypothetical protein
MTSAPGVLNHAKHPSYLGTFAALGEDILTAVETGEWQNLYETIFEEFANEYWVRESILVHGVVDR